MTQPSKMNMSLNRYADAAARAKTAAKLASGVNPQKSIPTPPIRPASVLTPKPGTSVRFGDKLKAALKAEKVSAAADAAERAMRVGTAAIGAI